LRTLRLIRVSSVLIGLLAAVPACSQERAAPVRQVAVTFDDLPVISTVFHATSDHRRITEDLLAAIARQRIPAIGFVNENKLETNGVLDPTRVALLERWLDAGLELGNHTYSHPDLHRTPLAAYQADVLRGERVLRPLIARRGGRLRYFRHPFLHTGTSLEERRAFEGFLEEHGYRVAPVTFDDYDYLFASAYDRATARRDLAMRQRIAQSYLDYMLRVVAYYEQQSSGLFGRNVRHVLLLHANALNADHLDGLATRLRARGYAFVTLDQALEDPIYRSEDRYVGPAGITWLHRWALTRGVRGSFFAGEPEVPEWVQQEANRGS
jgi:peptidoglycan/xylan/chitin deacetylase (PgdA/CDA1 family)